MAALIWDEQSQAFVEPTNVPMRYDQESGAWVETTGMAWDADAQAWAEKWSREKRLYLYKDGDECINITGGWKYQHYNYYSSSFQSVTPIIERRSDNLYTKISFGTFYCSLIGTENIIDVSEYKKMCCEVSAMYSTYGTQTGGIIVFDNGYRNNYRRTPYAIACYGGYNGEPAVSSDHTVYEVNIENISHAAFAIEHCADAAGAPAFVQLFKLWLE